ncbi:MAG: DNA repair protein RecO [Chlamydiales bacterium]|nr:DNA repair protein RecO [Chlamydiales bacterium]
MERCFGVVLSVLDFRESDQIVTLFTPGGIIKFFVKRRRSPLVAVLNEGEFVYVAGRGEMHRLRDGTILEQHGRLRERLENLEAAGKLVQAIRKSQMPGKAAPHLYQLFCYFLRVIPEVERPLDVAALFLVKTLKHEGIFQLLERCSLCENPPLARYGGERFCREHAPIEAVELSMEEEKRLQELAEGRSLKELLAKPIELHEQISLFFNQIFNNKKYNI